jgi:quinol monooxygenase YgiN
VILVLGSVNVFSDRLDEALAVSQEHVLRSRAEPGCIEHGVSVSVESPNRLVFVERWESFAALKAHFAVPASRQFAAELAKLASSPPGMAVYDSIEMKLGGAA